MLLIDAKMPNECTDCPCYDQEFCYCNLLHDTVKLFSDKPANCPLVEVDVVPISANIICQKNSEKDNAAYIQPYLRRLLTTKLIINYRNVDITREDIPDLPDLVRFTATKNVIIPKEHKESEEDGPEAN